MGQAINHQQLQAPISVNMNDLKDIKCNCGGDVFHNVMKMKALPALYSATGQAGFVQLQCFRCLNCGNVYTGEEMAKAVQSCRHLNKSDNGTFT